MDKKITRSDYLFILLFIFMLVLAMGAFFYGVKIGTDRTEAKYAPLVKQQKLVNETDVPYPQSHLVSFYHTVYSPFREFQLRWVNNLKRIENRTETDPSTMLRQMARFADEQYNAAVDQMISNSSPLLQESHDNYLRSLKLFAKGANNLKDKANAMSPSELLRAIAEEPNIVEAINFALTAQKQYFEAIVKWNESVAGELPHTDLLDSRQLTVDDWGKLNINLKNAYIANIMLNNRLFHSYTPQDMTYRVDEMIDNDTWNKWNAGTIPQIVDILASTEGVRNGDFIQNKYRFYKDDELPQLPFFFEVK